MGVAPLSAPAARCAAGSAPASDAAARDAAGSDAGSSDASNDGAIGSGGADATVWIERDAGSGPERAEGSRVYGKKDPVAASESAAAAPSGAGPDAAPDAGAGAASGSYACGTDGIEKPSGVRAHFQKPQVRLTRIQRRAGHRFGIGYRLRRRRCCRVCGAGLRFRGGRSPLHSSRRRVGGFRLRIDGLRRRSRTIPRAFRCFASSRLMRMLGKPVHEREQALQRQRIVVVLQHPLAFSRPRRSARCCAADRSEARLSNRAIGRHQPPTIANKP